MANTANIQRVFEIQGDEIHDDIPLDAAVKIFEGQAVSYLTAAGTAHTLVQGATENFGGFAMRLANNTTSTVVTAAPTDGLALSASVRVRTRGHVQLTVAAGGVLAGTNADKGLAVYASDGETFTGSNAANNVQIGKVERWVSGTTYIVTFEAAPARSV